MTVGSLFAGIGGFDLGFERAGFSVRWQVEIDPFARRVLEKHWPHVHRHDDIRTAGAHNLEPVDVICGGFPCQPVSQASRGRRTGEADARWLWPEMRRVVAELEPAWVVAENVPHLDRGELDAVVSDLEGLGYEVAPPLEVPACAFGHDHWRARIWICGYANRHRESRVPVHAETPWLSRPGDDTGGMGATDGLPGRVDRRRMSALGNAVVPQIPEWIARRILECVDSPP